VAVGGNAGEVAIYWLRQLTRPKIYLKGHGTSALKQVTFKRTVRKAKAREEGRERRERVEREVVVDREERLVDREERLVQPASQRERACSEEKKRADSGGKSKKEEAKHNLEKEFQQMTAFLNKQNTGEAMQQPAQANKKNTPSNNQEEFLKRVSGMLDNQIE